MYVLQKPDGLVVLSSTDTIVADTERDCFIGAGHVVYDPRPSSGVAVLERDFPEESYCAYQEVDGVLVNLRKQLPSDAGRKADMLAAVNTCCDALINGLTAGYPETEKMTFSKQEQEARAIVANPLAPTPLIDKLAQFRGVDKGDLVNRIIAKADLFAAFTGAVIGHRQALEDAITAAQTNGDLDAVDVEDGWPN